MAKVYAVWYDNCEQYEDNHTDVFSIHATYEGAVKKIESIIENARQDGLLLQLDEMIDPLRDEKLWNLRLKIDENDDDWWHEEEYSIEEYELGE